MTRDNEIASVLVATNKPRTRLSNTASAIRTIVNELKKASAGSFVNSIVTQLGYRTKKDLYTLRNGVVVRYKPGTLDLMVIRECLINNLYIKYIKEKQLDVVVDLGSHKGYFITGLLSNGVEIRRAVCVDPLLDNIDSFKQNIQLNRSLYAKIAGGIEFEQSAVASESGKQCFFITSNSVNHSLNDPTQYDQVVGRLTVDTISLEDLFRKYGLHSASLIKIDIEGTEFDLFRSPMYPLLLHCKYLVMEIHPSSHNHSEEILQKIIDAGFIVHYPNPAYLDLVVAIKEGSQ